jgi:hypothetical protein
MFEKNQKLEISQDELAVIEDALHTKSKILKIQAGAGGRTALDRLNAVKRTLAHIAQQHPSKQPPARRRFTLWGMTRILG